MTVARHPGTTGEEEAARPWLLWWRRFAMPATSGIMKEGNIFGGILDYNHALRIPG